MSILEVFLDPIDHDKISKHIFQEVNLVPNGGLYSTDKV